MTDRHNWGPQPKHRLAGVTLVGFGIGLAAGAYQRPWSFTVLSGLCIGAACGSFMLVKLALEARDRRAPVVKVERSNIVAIHRDSVA